MGILWEFTWRTCINNGDDVGIFPLENIQEGMETTIKGLGKKHLEMGYVNHSNVRKNEG